MRVLLIGSDTQAAIEARLARHLYGKAKILAKDSGDPLLDPGVQAADAGNPLPVKPAFSVPEHLRAALRAAVEGLLMCQQPFQFCRFAMELSLRELFVTREGQVFLTDEGKAALR